MQDRVPRWQRRTRRVLLTTEWAALALGIMADVINSEGSTTAVVAAASGGVWVLLATVIPPGQWDKPYRTELVANEMILLGDRHSTAHELHDDGSASDEDKDTSFPF